MTLPLTFTIPGDPAAQPRPRTRVIQAKGSGGAFAHIYTPDSIKEWKAAIQCALIGCDRAPLAGPVRVDIDFFFARPAWLNVPAAPAGPIPRFDRPDRDNLDKAVLDACTSLRVWGDDGQVCDGVIRKWWVARGSQPGARVTISPVVIDPVVIELHRQNQLRLERGRAKSKAKRAAAGEPPPSKPENKPGRQSGGGRGARLRSEGLAGMGLAGRVLDPFGPRR